MAIAPSPTIPRMGDIRTRMFATVAALLMFAAAITLLFDPEVVGGAGAPAATLVALYAAALAGLAQATWIARGSLLGGIYGRAVVSGNFAHAVVGFLALVRPTLRAPGFSASSAWLVVFGVFALAWGVLLFRASGLPRATG